MSAPISPTIAVVDNDADRYSFLHKLQQHKRAQLLFFPDGRSALRVTSVLTPSFWLVNDRLTDMRGLDCVEMLVELHPDARVFLIADEYNVDDERQCFRFARVKYLCRPLDVQWLSRLLPSISAIRPETDGPDIKSSVSVADRIENHQTTRGPTRAPPDD